MSSEESGGRSTSLTTIGATVGVILGLLTGMLTFGTEVANFLNKLLATGPEQTTAEPQQSYKGYVRIEDDSGVMSVEVPTA